MEKTRSERERARDRNILISLVIILAIVWIVREGSALMITGARIEADTTEDPYVRYITVSDPEADNPQIITARIFGEGIAVDKDYWELKPGGTVSMLAYITPPASGWIVIEGSPKTTGAVAYHVRVVVPVCVNSPCPVGSPEIEPEKIPVKTTAPLVETSPPGEVPPVPEVKSTESPILPRTEPEPGIPLVPITIGIGAVILAALFAYRAGIKKGMG